MAGFGTGVIPPRPARRTVGEYPRLPVRWLPKVGRSVVLSWPGAAQASLTRSSPSRLVIETAGAVVEIELREWAMPIMKGRQHGIRWRFACPHCGASRDALHWLPGEGCEGWGCRGAGCLNLTFASRHRERYCPAIRRRARLLRKLVRVRPGSLKAEALREMIAHQESLMLAHVQRVNGDLKKRRQRYAHRVDISQ